MLLLLQNRVHRRYAHLPQDLRVTLPGSHMDGAGSENPVDEVWICPGSKQELDGILKS